jgi:hypothetical protein
MEPNKKFNDALYRKTAEECLERIRIMYPDYTQQEVNKHCEDLYHLCFKERRWYRILWHELRALARANIVVIGHNCTTFGRMGEVCSQKELYDDEIVEIFIGEVMKSWVQGEICPVATRIRSVGLFRDNPYYQEAMERRMWGDAAVDETIRTAEKKAGHSLKIQFGVLPPADAEEELEPVEEASTP